MQLAQRLRQKPMLLMAGGLVLGVFLIGLITVVKNVGTTVGKSVGPAIVHTKGKDATTLGAATGGSS